MMSEQSPPAMIGADDPDAYVLIGDAGPPAEPDPFETRCNSVPLGVTGV
jgi:hypothetical protein